MVLCLKNFTASLNGVSKPWDLISEFTFQHLLLFRQLLHPSLACNLLAACILPAAPRRHEQCQEECHAGVEVSSSISAAKSTREDIPHESNQDAVASDVPRPVTREVDVRGDDATAVATHDLHGNARPSLETPADVAAVPGESERDLWIDAWWLRRSASALLEVRSTSERRIGLTNGGKDSACVLDMRLAAPSQQGKSQDGDQLEAQQEHAALPDSVCEIARRNCEDACKDIRRHAHQLRIIRGIVHGLDDGR